jgi:RNA polymerase sigma-70 factor (ECF subfamily)
MRAGDEQALGLLYDRWDTAVRVVALRIIGDPMEADDVVEDVFWQAWRQADRFDASRGGAGTWLLTIARSRALDRLRAARRARDDASLDDIDETSVEAAAVGDADPLEHAELLERADLLRGALDTLPGEQREALQLAYYEGLSQTEIAERTGEPLGTVKTRMRLALRKLRDRLGILDPGGSGLAAAGDGP